VENIKRKSIKAYILFESLLATALLALLITVVLSAFVDTQKKIARQNQEIEALNVSLMGLDTGQNHLILNGVDVEFHKESNKTSITNQGKEILVLEEKN